VVLPPHPALLTLHGLFRDTDEHGYTQIRGGQDKKAEESTKQEFSISGGIEKEGRDGKK